MITLYILQPFSLRWPPRRKFQPKFWSNLGNFFSQFLGFSHLRWFFHSHSPPRLFTVVGVGANDGLYGSAVGSVVVVVVGGGGGVVVGGGGVVVVDVDLPPSGDNFTSA